MVYAVSKLTFALFVWTQMVMLMDTSGSLDNPLYGGRYGNFR